MNKGPNARARMSFPNTAKSPLSEIAVLSPKTPQLRRGASILIFLTMSLHDANHWYGVSIRRAAYFHSGIRLLEATYADLILQRPNVNAGAPPRHYAKYRIT